MTWGDRSPVPRFPVLCPGMRAWAWVVGRRAVRREGGSRRGEAMVRRRGEGEGGALQGRAVGGRAGKVGLTRLLAVLIRTDSYTFLFSFDDGDRSSGVPGWEKLAGLRRTRGLGLGWAGDDGGL